jgi:diketogulonate reductase-like aldo/keto reductase
MSWSLANTTSIGVGFGTAALGGNTYPVVTMALAAGFRKFDTAEADWWYDQYNTGRALKDFFNVEESDDLTCEGLKISTKIPPWSLTSVNIIRAHANHSREELVGFCPESIVRDPMSDLEQRLPYPLDVYYIHAPNCWKGWHSRCDNAPPALDLREAWMGMEAVVGLDHNAERIGLSNVSPQELLGIIEFVKQRKAAGETVPPPRHPDVLQAFADPLRPANELREICKEHGIEFVSYSTLGTQHRSVDGNPVLTHPHVLRIAKKHGRSVAEVVLSWALQNAMSVIPRSNSRQHIQELARLITDPKFLDKEDLDNIDEMSSDEFSEL